MHIDRYERYWLIAVAAMLGAFMAALLAALIIFGVKLPTYTARVNPQNLANSEFANPGIVNVGGNKYEVHIVAQMWQFNIGAQAGTPPVIRVPKGSEVTFYVTSKDIIHGFLIQEHTLNLEVIPGQVAKATQKFNRTGTFNMVCAQYCGAGHAIMYGQIIVE